MSKKIFKTAFPQGLSKVSAKSGRFRHQEDQDWVDALLSGWQNRELTSPIGPTKIVSFAVIFLITFFILFLRVFHLQITKGYQNRELADSNRIQIKIIHAPRGIILDRNNQILARNEPGFRLVEASSSANQTRYITRDQALVLEIKDDPSFKNLEVDSLRYYSLGEKTAHLLGYVGEITAEELNTSEYRGYRLGDKIGRGGIEQIYEKTLRGVDGGEVIEVDSSGNKIQVLRQTPPTPGSNIVLSIDASLQSAAYDVLKAGIEKSKACCGSEIAEDPNTGEILSLVSYPSFNPTDISKALVSPHAALLNRVIAGTYPPGSTFKIVSSLAGLESGKITPSLTIEDTGVMSLGTFSFANWYFTEYGKTEGAVDLSKALQRSNDIYFYRLGQIIGPEIIADTARKLNLGKIVGIDLPGEEAGLVADNSWKQKAKGEVWYPGDTLHTAIGQGFNLVTPLQISNLISIIAASGKVYPPHLISRITAPDGALVKQFKFEPSLIKDFKKEHFEIVKEALSLVPKAGGTAWPFFTFSIPTAGKTGTAEFGDPKGLTHAWYTSFAPYPNPKIALTVLVEAGGEGSSVAGSISKEIYRWYFSPDKIRLSNFETNPAAASSSATTSGE